MKQKDTVDFIIRKVPIKTALKFRKQHLIRKASDPKYEQKHYLDDLINHRCN